MFRGSPSSLVVLSAIKVQLFFSLSDSHLSSVVQWPRQEFYFPQSNCPQNGDFSRLNVKKNTILLLELYSLIRRFHHEDINLSNDFLPLLYQNCLFTMLWWIQGCARFKRRDPNIDAQKVNYSSRSVDVHQDNGREKERECNSKPKD